MVSWNLGSVSAEVSVVYPNLPSALSGTGMNNITLGAINYVEQYTGNSIGSTNIVQKYHNAILYQTLINVTRSSNLNNNNVESTKIGDFSVKNTSSSEIVKTYSDMLKDELRILGRNINYYRTY